MIQQKQQIDECKAKFAKDFEYFADLKLTDLGTAELLLKELGELKIKHSGKKSEIAGLKN